MMVDNLDIGFYRVSMDGIYINHNPEHNRILGIDLAKDLKGKKTIDFWQNYEDRQIYLQELNENGFIRNFIVKANKINKEKIILQANSHLIKDSKGKIVAVEGSFTDITEKFIIEQKLKESEEKLKKLNMELEHRIEERTKNLKESEEKYRGILNNLQQGYFEVDLRGNYIFVNKFHAEYLRSFQDELTGKNYKHSFDKKTNTEIFNKFNEVYSKNLEKGTIEVETKGPDGILRTFETNIYLKYDSVGKKVGFYSTTYDISERKQWEQKLEKSEETLRAFMEGSPNFFTILDSELNYLETNEKGLRVMGKTREEVIGKNILEINPTLKETGRYEIYLEVLRTGKPHFSEDIVPPYLEEVYPNVVRNLHLNVSIFKVGDGLGVITSDITERAEAEQKLKESEQRLKKFMNSATDGFVLFDSKLNYLDVNTVTLQLVGMSREELLGKNILDTAQDLKGTKQYTDFLDVVKTGIPYMTEDVIFNRQDGTLSSNLSVRIFKVGNNLGMIFSDVTERKEAERRVEELSIMKSEFLRRASHELKTPLISIKGFSDLIIALHEDQLDPSILSKLREINDGCERLQNIINNLLKTSRLESPDIFPSKEKEDLSFLIKFCVHELESLAERRNQSIELDIHSELYAIIEKEEIHDVLSNLLTNAIKYTLPRGKIEIKTELKEDSVVISVTDNGIGFTEDQKTKIFKQFGKIERYGQGLDLGIDGTGLGLYISKKIVEAHGGEIWMESKGFNKGSTFFFSLPIIK